MKALSLARSPKREEKKKTIDSSAAFVASLDPTPGASIFALAFSPTGEMLASVDDRGRILIYDVAEWKLLRVYRNSKARMRAVIWHPIETAVMFGGSNGDVNTVTMLPVGEISSVHNVNGCVHALALSRTFRGDHLLVAFADRVNVVELVDHQIGSWGTTHEVSLRSSRLDVSEKDPVRAQDAHYSSQGGVFIVSTVHDGVLGISIEGNIVWRMVSPPICNIGASTLSPNGEVLAVANLRNGVDFYSMKDRKFITTVEYNGEVASSCNIRLGVVFLDDEGLYLAAVVTGGIALYYRHNKKPLRLLKQEKSQLLFQALACAKGNTISIVIGAFWTLSGIPMAEAGRAEVWDVDLSPIKASVQTPAVPPASPPTSTLGPTLTTDTTPAPSQGPVQSKEPDLSAKVVWHNDPKPRSGGTQPLTHATYILSLCACAVYLSGVKFKDGVQLFTSLNLPLPTQLAASQSCPEPVATAMSCSCGRAHKTYLTLLAFAAAWIFKENTGPYFKRFVSLILVGLDSLTDVLKTLSASLESVAPETSASDREPTVVASSSVAPQPPSYTPQPPSYKPSRGTSSVTTPMPNSFIPLPPANTKSEGDAIDILSSSGPGLRPHRGPRTTLPPGHAEMRPRSPRNSFSSGTQDGRTDDSPMSSEFDTGTHGYTTGDREDQDEPPEVGGVTLGISSLGFTGPGAQLGQ
ncbi:hypothetical protein PLICRDRAFT_176776 [Plicaturopsis crispa FD-325 SS-3]|nr:hypothetical protein PLICRDRAFT_176776 [Plicaturopsis crispa FD-325 SS-3]